MAALCSSFYHSGQMYLSSPSPPQLSQPWLCWFIHPVFSPQRWGWLKCLSRQAAQCAPHSMCCVLSHLAKQICLAPLWWASKALLPSLQWYWLLPSCGVLQWKCLVYQMSLSHPGFCSRPSACFVLRLTNAESSPYYFALDIFFLCGVLWAEKLLNPAGGWNKSSGFY